MGADRQAVESCIALLFVQGKVIRRIQSELSGATRFMRHGRGHLNWPRSGRV